MKTCGKCDGRGCTSPVPSLFNQQCSRCLGSGIEKDPMIGLLPATLPSFQEVRRQILATDPSRSHPKPRPEALERPQAPISQEVVGGLRVALQRHQSSGAHVLAIPAPRSSGPIWSDEIRGQRGRLEVLLAGWCPDCKNGRSICECRDWDSPYRARKELDFG